MKPLSMSGKKTSVKSSGSYDLLDRYMSEAKTTPLLSRDEERAFLELAVTGNSDARQRLVAANLRFVVKVAHEYKGYKIPLVDLIQEGNIGLLQAVDKFDHTKSCRLITYAVFWIRSAIQEFIMRNWSMVKIGTTSAERRLFYKVKSLSNQDTLDAAERDRRIAQLAQSVGAAESDIKTLEERVSRRDYSLATQTPESMGLTVESLIPDHAPLPDEQVVANEIGKQASELINLAQRTFTDREKEILSTRLLEDKKAPLRELSEKFKVSKERVRQLEVRIKEKIATFVESQNAATEYREQY